jgi:hypothetical protein
MNLRSVSVYKYGKVERDGRVYNEKVFDACAKFHQFGVSYEEFDNGAAPFSTAIVELQDGTVRNVPVEMIKFLSI